ncbi:hypothetical protein Y5S_02105 [Alcanivorax nanhaiticus]|uniref:Copper-binding protein n=1 Tax=Alcanivorax nanhaiticus TaxID=1177154 RepID=A0A095SK82_9GAMM|nr:hypothetical protein [Alcanivorax nanhaiticus]KGD64739.1 hypothetical protein Y5S_02105 [Alcanivorax nanhaiticus]
MTVLRVRALVALTTFLWAQGSWGHGILPDEIPMAAGTALREPGQLTATPVLFSKRWQPAQLSFPQGVSRALTFTNHSDDWHLFALGDNTALRDQNLIHRLMPDLRKDYPNTRLSEPGSTVSLPWRFDVAGLFELRCVRADHQQQEPSLLIKVVPYTPPR